MSLIIRMLLFSCLLLSNTLTAQSLKNSIDGNDAWGAWMIKGASQVWLVDSIPERARLWDYNRNEVIASFEMQTDVKDVNVLDDGSLAYVKHSDKHAYIILRADGSQIERKFGYNAPSYYIHPNGNYFFGSLLEGFVTYSFNGNKISKSKANKGIRGPSNGFLNTNFENAIWRIQGDSIQKISIAPDGSLSPSMVVVDKQRVFLNSKKDELLFMSSMANHIYSLPDFELKKTDSKNLPSGFLSGVYDSEERVLYCSKSGKISTYDLEEGKWRDEVDLGTGDVYFEDRQDKTVVCYSDLKKKFFIIEL